MGLLRRQSQELDSVGVPLAGAKLYTYRAGTTANKATYSDDGLTVANANPILADGSGRFPAVYGERITADAFADYKLVLKTSSDVTIWTSDDVSPSSLANELSLERIKQIASNPLDYGAIGNGVADETAQVQSAIDNVSGTGIIDLLGLTYKCNTGLTLPSGVTLKNGKLDFSSCTSSSFIQSAGTLGAATTTTGAATTDGISVAVASVSGLATGDLVSVSSANPFTNAVVRGEILEIESIASLVISFSSPFRDDYASGVSLRKINTVDDVTIEDVEILGPSSTGAGKSSVVIVNGRRTRIRNVFITNIDTIGIAVAGSHDTVIRECSFFSGADGVSVMYAGSQTKISECSFGDLKKGVALGTSAALTGVTPALGIQRDTVILDSSFRVSAAAANAINAGHDAQGLLVQGCNVQHENTDTSPSVVVDCGNVKIEGNNINRKGIGAATTPAIELKTRIPLRATEAFVNVDGNHVLSDSRLLSYSPASPPGVNSGLIESFSISRNVARAFPGSDIVLTLGAATEQPSIVTLTMRDNDTNGKITITGGHAGNDINRVNISGGRCDSIKITNATVAAPDVLDVSITDVVVLAVSGTSGIDVVGGDSVKVTGCTVDGDATMLTGLKLVSIGSLSVIGCSLGLSRTASINIGVVSMIDVDQSSNGGPVAMTGNTIDSSASSGHGVKMTGVSAGTRPVFLLSSNRLTGGGAVSPLVLVTNRSEPVISSNTFLGVGTALSAPILDLGSSFDGLVSGNNFRSSAAGRYVATCSSISTLWGENNTIVIVEPDSITGFSGMGGTGASTIVPITGNDVVVEGDRKEIIVSAGTMNSMSSGNLMGPLLGQEIIIKPNGTITLVNGASVTPPASSLIMRNGVTDTVNSSQLIKFVYDGFFWKEVWRTSGSPGTYTMTGTVPLTTYNASGATLFNLADVVTKILIDLRNAGIVG